MLTVAFASCIIQSLAFLQPLPPPASAPSTWRANTFFQDATLGSISDMCSWNGDAGQTIGVVGSHGVRLLNAEGNLVASAAFQGIDGDRGSSTRFAFVELDGNAPPEIITIEQSMRMRLTAFSITGKRLWEWSLPEHNRREFGVKFVAPFRGAAHEVLLAVWAGGASDVSVLNAKGELIDRRPWGSTNGDGTALRLPTNAAGLSMAYGSDGSVIFLLCPEQRSPARRPYTLMA